MKIYSFSIPTPCNAVWKEMTPTADGRFCSQCEKVLVDFSGMTDREIVGYFEKHGRCCGRFAVSQLNREIDLGKSSILPTAMLAAVLTLVIPESGKAQITGVVTMEKTGQPVAGCTVRLINSKGLWTKVGTETKGDGRFTLNIPEDSVEIVKVGIASIGFKSKIVAIEREQVATIQLEAYPVEDEKDLVVGGPSVKVRKRSKIGNWFRKTFR